VEEIWQVNWSKDPSSRDGEVVPRTKCQDQKKAAVKKKNKTQFKAVKKKRAAPGKWSRN